METKRIRLFPNYAAPVTTTTTTTVASSVNPSTYGQSVTFTATVTSSSTPTGSVNFVIDGGAPVVGTAGATTATTATWTFTTSTLTVAGSPHSVQANYVHTGSFTDSNGTLSGGQTVNKATSTVTVNCPASVVYTGSAQAPCTAEATGVGMSPVDVTASLVYGGNTDVGTASADASWGGDGNHFGSNGSGSFEITQSTPTAAPSSASLATTTATPMALVAPAMTSTATRCQDLTSVAPSPTFRVAPPTGPSPRPASTTTATAARSRS